MKVWFTLAVDQTRPAEFLAESNENLKWAEEEGDNEYILALGSIITGTVACLILLDSLLENVADHHLEDSVMEWT